MDQNLTRTDLLPASLDLWVLLVLAALGVAAWVVGHWAIRRYGSNRFDVWRRGLLGVPLGVGASWLVLQALARVAFLSTPWPLFFGAILSAVSLEAVSAFYLHECSRVKPGVARALVACRMAAVVIVLLVLMQPVVVADRDRKVRERVVVLIDDSGSMHFTDRQLTETEKQDVVTALGLKAFPEKGLTRAQMVRQLLNREGGDKFLAEIAKKYEVDVFAFGNGIRRATLDGKDEESVLTAQEKMFRSVTDLTKALELTIKEIPAEEIASILIFTDGRHNGEAGVDSIARRLGGYGIKVSSVILGGTVQPFDLAVAAVDAPESVFLGDKVRFTVKVSATGANGRKSSVRFLNAQNEVIEEKPFTVEGNVWSKEFKFTDRPDAQGVYHYSFSVKGVPRELFADNNTRELDVAVSDDRTNVLIVDGRPRWEYRYLRNLFYGRDKSVHLQDWIVHPDTIRGFTDDTRPPASASRRFGDSEAGGWPVKPEDWRQFDVIIVGDVGEDVLTPDVAYRLEQNVEVGGALLVFVSGAEYLPTAIHSERLRNLMPIEFEPDDVSHRDAPEDAFVFQLTAQGRGHPVMTQSSSPAENEEIWQSLPDFHWRLPIRGVKPDAEVLAYARPRAKDGSIREAGALAESIAAELENDPEAAIRRLEAMRGNEARNALVVAQNRGRGRVLMLLTDDMWRLRSKAGDQLHHRFWGEVMRWGAGEKLRSGNAYVRLGTDQLRYGAGETVKAFVRFRDEQRNGLEGLDARLVVYPPGASRGRAFEAVERPDANGFYACEITGCNEPGEYRILLDCPDAQKKLDRRMPVGLQTSFVVVTTKRPAEEVEITATRAVAERMANATGGRVMTPGEYVKRADDSTGGSKTLSDRVEYPLWSLPPLFILVLIFLSTEWILRKRASLS